LGNRYPEPWSPERIGYSADTRRATEARWANEHEEN